MPSIPMNPSQSVCPVPLEQQPINEYKTLQDSCFARWAILEHRAFLMRTFTWWLGAALLTAPIAYGSIDGQKHPLLCVLSDTAGATILLLLVMVRLYLGWAYVCDRLSSEAIFYEETGWYDGQTWVKPMADRAHEQLIATYEVRPFLRRLRYGFAVGFAGLSLNIALCVTVATWA